jgi:hypothetical protein
VTHPESTICDQDPRPGRCTVAQAVFFFLGETEDEGCGWGGKVLISLP